MPPRHLFLGSNVGRKIGRLAATETHIRHDRMRIQQEERQGGSVEVRVPGNKGKRWRLAGGSGLIRRNRMASGAPLARQSLAILGVGGQCRQSAGEDKN